MKQAEYLPTRIFALVLFLCTLTGCQTMQGWLKPYVCDCAESASSGQACAAPQPGEAADMHAALDSCRDATTTALDSARAESSLLDGSAGDEASGEPNVRTLARRGEPAADPMALVDPTVAEARVALGDPIQQGFGLSLDKDSDATIFQGNFSKKPGNELIVVKAGREILAYGADARIARMDFDGVAAPEAFAQLGLDLDPSGASAVKMVHDDTLQLLVHWRSTTEEGTFSYHVGIFKVIGPFFAKIFTRTLATSDTADGPLLRKGTYEILHGDAHRFIRWIPADDTGELLTDQAALLKWNRWEGMFRVPRPPAAGPKREKLHARAWYEMMTPNIFRKFGDFPG